MSLGVGSAIILLAGAIYYFVVQLPAKQIAEIQLEKAKSERQQDKERGLSECLEKVEMDYKRKVELNSVSAPTEEYPDARRWNNSDIHLIVEKKYNDDRDFCVKLYVYCSRAPSV